MDVITADLLVCSHGSGPASGRHRYGLPGPARSKNLTDAVLDPAPVRPIAAGEEGIRVIYQANLKGFYRKPAG